MAAAAIDPLAALASAAASSPRRRRRSIEYATPAPRVQHVQTIERTSKRWKGLMLLGFLMLALGTAIAVYGMMLYHNADGSGQLVAIGGATVMVVGLLVYFIAYAAAWWENG